MVLDDGQALCCRPAEPVGLPLTCDLFISGEADLFSGTLSAVCQYGLQIHACVQIVVLQLV